MAICLTRHCVVINMLTYRTNLLFVINDVFDMPAAVTADKKQSSSPVVSIQLTNTFVIRYNYVIQLCSGLLIFRLFVSILLIPQFSEAISLLSRIL